MIANPAYDQVGSTELMTAATREQQLAQRRLLAALRRPGCYPHPVRDIRFIETHISTIVLTGEFAYKIKKPLNLGFLDFSTPQQRKFYCEEELRLNGRLAPHIYLDVVAFTGSPEAPVMRAHGEGFEYAVRMHEFDQHCLVSSMLSEGRLTIAHTGAVAGALASFHTSLAARAGGDSGRSAATRVLAPMLENFTQLDAALRTPALRQRLGALQKWTRERCHLLRGVIEARARAGFVRECHGDLHLENIALIDGQVTLFDGIEFNPWLRWIDTANEIAFTVMDYERRGAQDHANHFLSTYLEATGDYGALELLDLFKVYRALVRAKVAVIRAQQECAMQDADPPELAPLVALAERYARPAMPRLFITHGLSGAGKSFVSAALVLQQGVVRLRSDLERKRLFGLAATAQTGSAVEAGIYDEAATRRTYERLAELAEQCLEAGYSVVVDATFLRQRHRELFRALAARHGVGLCILDIHASEEDIVRRLEARGDTPAVSEAGREVLLRQLQVREPLSEAERAHATLIENRTGLQPNFSALERAAAR